jgi:TonB family protein
MLESYLVSVALKSTILLAAGCLLARLLRGRCAESRHLVCLATLLSAAAVFLLALWSPHWSVLISVPARHGAGSGANGAISVIDRWPLAVSGLWAAGVLALLLRAGAGWAVLTRVRRGSAYFPAADGIEVRIADVTTPLTCGVLRPMIMLPASARAWEPDRLRAVLLHESAHVRRCDCLAKYASQAARALLWWNPLAWILAARASREQELACDEAVLRGGIPAETYATFLMEIARECRGRLLFGCAMAGGPALSERLAHLFRWREGQPSSTRRTALAIPLLLALMTTVSFAQKVYRMGPGIVAPKVIEKSEPQYTDEAREAKIEGKVALSVVIGTDGVAHDIKIVKSLDSGLDTSAITSIKTWKFQPGMKDSKPVQVRAMIEVNFQLH